METENGTPVETAPEVDGLFTDQPNDGGSMLPDAPEFDGAAPSATAPAPEPGETKTGEKVLRIKMPNGHVYAGKTETELLEQLYKGKIAADATIADRESQIRTLRVASTVTLPSPTAPIVTPTEGEWDAQKYLDMLGTDPIKAQKYVNRFANDGADNEKIDYAYKVAQRIEQQSMTADFLRRNPDYVPSDDTVEKMTRVMGAHGLSTSLVNLEWAYTELKRTGAVAPAMAGDGIEFEYQDITFGVPPVTPARVSRGGGAPPSPRAAGSSDNVDAINAETMPLPKLREHLRKIGALQE